MQLNETTLEITELPLNSWTQDYKEFLEGLIKPEKKARFAPAALAPAQPPNFPFAAPSYHPLLPPTPCSRRTAYAVRSPYLWRGLVLSAQRAISQHGRLGRWPWARLSFFRDPPEHRTLNTEP